MNDFKPSRILVPTDFSDLASEALAYGARIAEKANGELIVVYADTFLPPPHFTYAQVGDIASSLQTSKEQALEELQKYVGERVKGVRVEPLVIEDLPISGILATAQEREVDLIVMGTHGRSGLTRVMLGSVTERVIRETSIPLLAVRSGASTAEMKRIVCPTNFSEAANDALRHAVGMARLFESELVVVHVVEPGRRVVTQGEMEKLCSWVQSQVTARCEFEELVVGTDAAEQIIEITVRQRADLVVVGAQHRRFSDTTVVGTTTVRITRHAQTPVMIVARRLPADLQ